MYIEKNFNYKRVLHFGGPHFLWIAGWVSLVTVIYELTHWYWIAIPWLPLSLIGTAVAFYIGFKNNQAYDRLWEARKIWGGIVNTSRSFATALKAYITDQFADENLTETALNDARKHMIYRHIGWLYTLRDQLLIPTQWEHISQGGHVGKVNEKRRKVMGVGLYGEIITEQVLKQHLAADEYEKVIYYKNTATQLLDNQSQALVTLRKKDWIEDFRHMELQNYITELFTHQGKAERIKKFPLPRQYGSMSAMFVGIFIFLLPFGTITEFHKIGQYGIWLSIPLTTLVA